MKEAIEHKGNIVEITNEKVVVRIISLSMCSSCHAKGACISHDSKEKDIEVRTKEGLKYKIGEEVTVCLKQKLGAKAVLIGFILPFLVMFITALVFNKYVFPNNEALTALSAIISIIIYYFIIFKLRKKIDKGFSFYIKSS
jgi:sigma-E factor negative regulatory protein RseC